MAEHLLGTEVEVEEEEEEEEHRLFVNEKAKKNTERPKEAAWKGDIVRSIIYGGLDAIITSFSLISSISASHLSSVDVLALGFANLVADGISMGFGDFVSTSTEKDVAAKEKEVTQWDVTNQTQMELDMDMELLNHYQRLGMDINDATTVVHIIGKYKDVLVDEKMRARNMKVPSEEEKAWKNGVVTFLSFLAFGSAPLLSFIVLIPFTDNDSVKFVGACVLAALALLLLGIAKAKFAGQSYLLSAAVTLFNGTTAASAAYVLGWGIKKLAGVNSTD